MKKGLKLTSTTLILISLLILNYSCKKEDDCTELTWYQDADDDGFGNPANSQQSCSQPTGFVTDNTDFDDTNASLNPEATEICNGIDDNGNGVVDEDAEGCGLDEVCENGSCVAATTYYRDNDDDGYGDPNNSIVAGSTAPTGYVINSGDCDDTNNQTNPSASEIPGNSIDDNCNGEIDE